MYRTVCGIFSAHLWRFFKAQLTFPLQRETMEMQIVFMSLFLIFGQATRGYLASL